MRSQIRAAIADLNRHGFGLCAFIADSIFSSDGVFSPPDNGARCPSQRKFTGLGVSISRTRFNLVSVAPAMHGGDSSAITWSLTS